MIDTDKYKAQLEDDNTDTWVVWRIAKESLAEVKRLREVIDKEHPTFDWASRQTIANLEAEVKRLREAIADIANNMEAADPSYLQGFIKDLLEVIER